MKSDTTDHTPGPWTAQSLEPSTIGHDWVDGPDRRCVAVCSEIVGNGPHGYCQRVDTDEIAANARLIAAAPDLLQALEEILPWHDSHPAEKTDNRIVNLCRDAIAKAKGVHNVR